MTFPIGLGAPVLQSLKADFPGAINISLSQLDRSASKLKSCSAIISLFSLGSLIKFLQVDYRRIGENLIEGRKKNVVRRGCAKSEIAQIDEMRIQRSRRPLGIYTASSLSIHTGLIRQIKVNRGGLLA